MDRQGVAMAAALYGRCSNAQIQAVKLYHRFNFTEVGEEFMDADIPHVRMQLRLH